MSRGFVKEGDQEETPMVPPRAFLPAGVVNYVTPTGMEQLLQERQQLLEERERYVGNHETDNRVMRNYVNAKLELLENRIRIAKIVQSHPNGEIAFGSTCTILMGGEEHCIQITGVDEAASNKGKIPFTSPLAKALYGHYAGEFLDVQLPSGLQSVKIIRVE